MIPIEHVSERPADTGAPPVPASKAGGPPPSAGVPIAWLSVPAKGEE